MLKSSVALSTIFIVIVVLVAACGGGSDSSGIGVTPQNDITSPIISFLVVQSSLSTKVAINWQTDEPATHVISYGTTASLGQNSIPQASFIKSHIAILSGLTINMQYFYRITTSDINNNITVSPV